MSTAAPVHEEREPSTYIEGVGEVPGVVDDSKGETWRKFVRETGWTGQGNMISCSLEVDPSAPPTAELLAIIVDFLMDPYKGQQETGSPGHLRVRDVGAYAVAHLNDELQFQVSPFELPYERDLKIRKLVADYIKILGRGTSHSQATEDE